jgi:hypothetical protein
LHAVELLHALPAVQLAETTPSGSGALLMYAGGVCLILAAMVRRAFAQIQAVFATCPSTVCGREMLGVSQVFVSRRLQNSNAGNQDKVN